MFESSRRALAPGSLIQKNIVFESSPRFALNKKPGLSPSPARKSKSPIRRRYKSGMYQPSRRALAPGSLIEKNIGVQPSRRALAPGSL